ncbi:MAG: T9SS type A sorting domain-containing protein [Flavobacteriaceae bacterium]|nr:T9SS type A sorting domain-containing protein [Flavobacteriaceae bacterium]
MNKKKLIALFLCLFGLSLGFAQETFNVMFYNVLNYPDQTPASRIDNLEAIITNTQPDIFMVCEVNNVQGSNNILNMLQGVKPDYAGANFVLNTSDDTTGNQNDLQNMMYYDASKFILVSQDEVPTTVRDFNHYVLKLNSVDQNTNPIFLNLFVCHLKASSGDSNQAIRFEMVTELISYMDANLANDDLVLLGGDLNLYTHTENAFIELVDTSNNITFVDPANRQGSWHNNVSFVDVFTQSTRTQTGLGGATGGFDDRFDFIMTSENMITNSDLYYVPNSYKVYGNNANTNCYNDEIISSNCAGPEYDLTIRNELYQMSDHLPVLVQLETFETILGVEDLVQNASLQVLGPNVLSDWLRLQATSAHLIGERLSVFNPIGQKMTSMTINDLNQFKINVSNWSSGIYYVVVSNNYIQPIKFIKK